MVRPSLGMEMLEQYGLASIFMHMGMPKQHHTYMSLGYCGTRQPIFLATSIGTARRGRAIGCTILVKKKGYSGRSTKARSSGPLTMAASCLYIRVSDRRRQFCLDLIADLSRQLDEQQGISQSRVHSDWPLVRPRYALSGNTDHKWQLYLRRCASPVLRREWEDPRGDLYQSPQPHPGGECGKPTSPEIGYTHS